CNVQFHPCLSFLDSMAPPRSPLFPYTTLFRSTLNASVCKSDQASIPVDTSRGSPRKGNAGGANSAILKLDRGRWTQHTVASNDRSEEHTSELQSRENLVCRLLLENKKRTTIHL